MGILNTKSKRNPVEKTTEDMAVAYEINEQDLVGKSAAGAGNGIIRMTLAGKCGLPYTTLSADCSTSPTRCM